MPRRAHGVGCGLVRSGSRPDVPMQSLCCRHRSVCLARGRRGTSTNTEQRWRRRRWRRRTFCLPLGGHAAAQKGTSPARQSRDHDAAPREPLAAAFSKQRPSSGGAEALGAHISQRDRAACCQEWGVPECGCCKSWSCQSVASSSRSTNEAQLCRIFAQRRPGSSAPKFRTSGWENKQSQVRQRARGCSFRRRRSERFCVRRRVLQGRIALSHRSRYVQSSHILGRAHGAVESLPR